MFDSHFTSIDIGIGIRGDKWTRAFARHTFTFIIIYFHTDRLYFRCSATCVLLFETDNDCCRLCDSHEVLRVVDTCLIVGTSTCILTLPFTENSRISYPTLISIEETTYITGNRKPLLEHAVNIHVTYAVSNTVAVVRTSSSSLFTNTRCSVWLCVLIVSLTSLQSESRNPSYTSRMSHHLQQRN